MVQWWGKVLGSFATQWLRQILRRHFLQPCRKTFGSSVYLRTWNEPRSPRRLEISSSASLLRHSFNWSMRIRDEFALEQNEIRLVSKIFMKSGLAVICKAWKHEEIETQHYFVVTIQLPVQLVTDYPPLIVFSRSFGQSHIPQIDRWRYLVVCHLCSQRGTNERDRLHHGSGKRRPDTNMVSHIRSALLHEIWSSCWVRHLRVWVRTWRADKHLANRVNWNSLGLSNCILWKYVF